MGKHKCRKIRVGEIETEKLITNQLVVGSSNTSFISGNQSDFLLIKQKKFQL